MRISFWQLISQYNIVIPSIQRDYAQGRDTPQAKSIRNKFISALINSISNDQKIYLDFIYGKLKSPFQQELLESNKENMVRILNTLQQYADNISLDFNYSINSKNDEINERKDFIPLDGQQRLTTLFILHWYILFRFNELEPLKRLSDFQYRTRTGSRDFILFLCQIDFRLIDLTSQKLSKEIINQKAFYLGWQRDPTVQGILAVIDLIHAKLKDTEPAELMHMRSNLITNNCIQFDFLDLKRFELTDELYVKMNARGKQLSDFENFKVWLLKIVEQGQITIVQEKWKTNLDVTWLDIFWNFKGDAIFEIDDSYLLFFKLNFMPAYMKTLSVVNNQFNYHSNSQGLSKHDEIVSDLEKLRNVEVYFDPEIRFDNNLFRELLPDFFNILECLSGDIELLKTLNIISEQDFGYKYIGCNPTEHIFGERSKKLNWWGAAYYYFIMAYILKAGKPLSAYTPSETLAFKRFSRVAMNLIFNIRIETGPIYLQVILGIDELIANCHDQRKDIYELLAGHQNPLTGMDVAQSLEECQKARLICKDANWEQLFLKAENNNYFYGQIAFIINLAGEDQKLFEYYFENLNALFSDDDILKDPFHLFQRALLTKGKYLFPKGQNLSFFINNHGTVRERNENWRNLFDHEKHLEILKKLLDDELFDKNNVSQSLQQIIIQRAADVTDYTKKFIMNHRLIDFSKTRLIREWGDGPNVNVYILNSSKISGIFYELHTLDVFLRIHDHYYQAYYKEYPTHNWDQFHEKFKTICKYRSVKGVNNEPTIRLLIEEGFSIDRGADDHNFKVISQENVLLVINEEELLYQFMRGKLDPYWYKINNQLSIGSQID